MGNMRTRHFRRGSSHRWVTAVMATALLGLSGCARRFYLEPKELEKVQTEAGVQPLRVYTHRKLIAIYDESDKDETFRVEREIKESARNQQVKKIITRNTAGLILKIDESNGMPLLWVTFDPSCTEVDCAFGFVQAEDGRYRLHTVPKREGYEDARAFRHCVWKKRRLKPGKMSSLAEANEVYLVKKRNGKILTIDLDVKKKVDRRTQTDTERSRGIQ
jgi:hypothetical protein